VPDIEALPWPAWDLLDPERYYRLDSPRHFPKRAAPCSSSPSAA